MMMRNLMQHCKSFMAEGMSTIQTKMGIMNIMAKIMHLTTSNFIKTHIFAWWYSADQISLRISDDKILWKHNSRWPKLRNEFWSEFLLYRNSYNNIKKAFCTFFALRHFPLLQPKLFIIFCITRFDVLKKNLSITISKIPRNPT